MWNLRKVVAAVFLLFFLFTAPSTADIISVKFRSDNRNKILFSNFEFSNTGYVSVAVSSVGVTSNSSQPDPSRIGFFLQSESDDSFHYPNLEFKRNPNLCPFDNKSISVLFTFSDLSPPPHSSFNKSYNVTNPGEYSLYFANCNNQSLVSMDVRAELYNTGDDGVTKDYLSAGETHPSFYFNFFLVYLCFQGLWIYVSIKNHRCVQLIHIPMSMLLVMNLLYFICAFGCQHDLMITGNHNGYWLFYIIRFMREVNFFTVILLIGVGWCNWRPFLPDWAIIHLMVVILFHVFSNNMYFIMVAESGPYNENWLESRSTFRCMDFMGCVFYCLYVFISFLLFKEDTDTSDYVRSYRSFKGVTVRHVVFPFLVLAYVIFTRGLDNVLQDTAFQEVCTLVFLMAVFYMYRPFVLEDEDQKYVGFLV